MERGFFYSQKDKLNYIHFSRSQFILWNSLKTQYFHIYKRGILIESIIHLAKQLLIYCYFFSWTIEKHFLQYLFRAWASDESEARRKIRHRFLFQQNLQEEYNDLLHKIETNQNRLELEFRKRRSWDWSQSARTCPRFQQGDQDAQFWGARTHFVFIRLKFLSQLKASSPLTGSLGAKMMEKMGWRDGEGLGKDRWEANILWRETVKYGVIKYSSRGGWGLSKTSKNA